MMEEPYPQVKCPRKSVVDCGHLIVMHLTDGKGKVYGFRGRCSECDSRTTTAESVCLAIEKFERGKFIALPPIGLNGKPAAKGGRR